MTFDQVLRDGDTLVSAGEIYELGFFSPGRSTNRFLGIWYKNISPQTVVWVANRKEPITDSSGVLRISTNGSLLVSTGSNSNNTVVWSSNTSLVSFRPRNPVAQLLDSGNLVVREDREGSFIWQSFNYPGDTILPGMTYLCDQFRVCGPNGVCNPHNSPACSCMVGFEPRSPDEWSASEWSSGCRRKTPLDCPNGDGFRVFKNIKLPYYSRSWYNWTMTLSECANACKKNCSCTAYANIEITNGGSECLLWFDDLYDIRTVEESQDLYVRMALSDIAITRPVPESTSKSSSNKKRQKLILAVSISSSLFTVTMILAIVYAWNKRRRYLRKTPEYSMKSQQDDDIELLYVSLAEISKSTENFSKDKKLGQGGFGPVYMGVLDDGREIAVKKLSKTSRQGVTEFNNELKFIAKLQHRNLVKLFGYCNEGDESMLIYEYMPNKSLDIWIFDRNRSLTLDWSHRFNIIHGIVRGLLYLHHDSRFKIVHRDLKASNILLDNDMSPKISDFGLARMFKDQENEAKTNRVVGTLGYISPEYAVEGTFSEKSDVFSFGVLVLEIVSGKTNRGFSRDKDKDNLLAYAWSLYEEGMALELLGAHMRESCVDSEVLRSIHIGLLCVQHHAKDRPTMLSVALMFDQDGALPPPKQPAFFAEGTVPEVSRISVNEVSMTTLEPR